MTEGFAALAVESLSSQIVARPPVRVTWHSFDLRTGSRGPQLRVQSQGAFGRILCEPTEAEIAVRIEDNYRQTLIGWDEATLPGRTMLAALDQEGSPLWGGLVYRRRSNASPWVTCSLVTLESYFSRRFVSDQSYSLEQQTLIAEGLIDSVATDGIEVVVDAADTARRITRQYFTDEDKDVLSVLTELAGVQNGIEFTIDLVWADTERTQLQPTFRIADRIGGASERPTAVFSLPGNVTDFEYLEDYSTEFGANAVRAVSSGEGDTRPESPWMTHLEPGWPKYERIITPSTSIINTSVLTNHAAHEVEQTWDGLRELTLEANLQTSPRVGTDWDLGDTVGVSLTCPRFPERANADGEVVAGYQAVVRAFGWEMDLDADRIRPRLLELTPVDVEEL